MPFISVIIPVYNVEKYIKRCINSLTKQSYQDYEILLIDDGSTDNSGTICDEIKESNARVKVYHKENGGLASARNYGLDHACGEYIVFVDSDDWVVENFFESIDRHLKETKVDILKYGFRRVFNEQMGKIAIPYYEVGIYERKQIMTDILPGAIGPIQLFNYNKDALMSACTCAYSHSLINRNNIRFVSEREILNEDYLFNFHALLCATNVEITHEVLYLYDFRDGSLSKRYIDKILERKTNLMEAYKKLLKQYGLFDIFERAYYNQCVDSFYACVTNECGCFNRDRNIREISNAVNKILNSKKCVESLKKCNYNNLDAKGCIIYFLMRMKMSKSIVYLYKKLKG